MGPWDTWSSARYLALTTFRRDGTPVATPVWFAAVGDEVVVQTEAGSGKVKRIRNRPDVTVAPCDMRGRTTVKAFPATARVLDDREAAAAERALAGKYGMQRRVFAGAGRVGRAVRRVPERPRAYLAVRPATRDG